MTRIDLIDPALSSVQSVCPISENLPAHPNMKLPKIDWKKNDGLVPAIVQDAATLQVLMLGYMNAEALEEDPAHQTRDVLQPHASTGSGPRARRSRNFLHLVSVEVDCDNDTLLVKANADRSDLPPRHDQLLRR